MKKRYLVLIIIGGLLITGLLIFFIGIPVINNLSESAKDILPADMSKLVYMDDEEEFADISRGTLMFCAVSDKGNCYVNGARAEKNFNYGLDNYSAYNHADPDKWVQIYGGGDAVSVDMFSDDMGGCIFTGNHDVYLFLNRSDTYKTPTYYCSGYVSADKLNDETLYMLSENGDLETRSLSDPDNQAVIGNNIKKFCLDKKDEMVIFALTEDNRLYITKNGEAITAQTPYIDHIIDFDYYYYSSKYGVLSLLTDDNTAYAVIGNHELSYDALSDESIRVKCGQNIISVSSYNGGIAMLDNNADVKLYGTQINDVDGDLAFQGESVFHDVRSVSGEFMSICIIKQDGSLLKFGHHAAVGGYNNLIEMEE